MADLRPPAPGKNASFHIFSIIQISFLVRGLPSLHSTDSARASSALTKRPYSPGEITAVGYRDGHEAGRWSLRTAGAPVSARVSVDRPQVRANGEDLAYATVELLDAAGTSVYALSGDRDVRVKVSGAGALAGIGNGDPVDASSFQSGKRKTFHGRVVAAVRAGTDAGRSS